MSTIKISDLHPPGYHLFEDSESFLLELCVHAMTPLEYRDIGMLQGGIIISQVSYSQGFIGDPVPPTNENVATLQPQLQVLNAFDNLL